MADQLPIPFIELIKLHNTVDLVANDYWRKNYEVEVACVKALVNGHVETLTEKGWSGVEFLYKDVAAVSPLTLYNPKNLPTL